MRVRQISAVGLRRHETEKNIFIAVYGFRRIRAALLVKLPKIRGLVLEDGLSETEIEIIQLTENMKREDLTDQEVYRACKKLQALNPALMKKDIAGHLNLDPSMMARILSVDELITEGRDAFLSGAFGFTISYEISHESQEVQHELLAARLNGHATREELKRMRACNGNAATVKVPSVKIALAGEIQVVVKGKEIDLESCAEALAEAGKQVKKALAEQLDAKTAQAVWRDRAKAGGQ
jgi:ParB-like chromosome segregation protein Spo0J